MNLVELIRTKIDSAYEWIETLISNWYETIKEMIIEQLEKFLLIDEEKLVEMFDIQENAARKIAKRSLAGT